MNFSAALKRLQADLDPDSSRIAPWPTNRPVVSQPLPTTDGMDPAAPGGPAPMNSAAGPFGTPVASDPLLETPIQRGMPIPHVEGPDLDTTTLD